jgi:hypothetical protein
MLFISLTGTGYVCSTYLGSPSSIDIIRMYNLSSDMVGRYFLFALFSFQLENAWTKVLWKSEIFVG